MYFGGQHAAYALVQGGGPTWKFFNDTFLLTIEGEREGEGEGGLLEMKWEEVKTTGTPPSPRVGHRSVIIKNKLWVFGGTFLKEDLLEYYYYNDLHTLDLGIFP